MAEIPIIAENPNFQFSDALIPARLYMLLAIYDMNKYTEEMNEKFGFNCKNKEGSN